MGNNASRALCASRSRIAVFSLLGVRFHNGFVLGDQTGAEIIPEMSDQEWIKTLDDGRRVKFIYQELPEDGAFITAQIAGNEIVYSVVLTKARNPLTREDVESHFTNELSKK